MYPSHSAFQFSWNFIEEFLARVYKRDQPLQELTYEIRNHRKRSVLEIFYVTYNLYGRFNCLEKFEKEDQENELHIKKNMISVSRSELMSLQRSSSMPLYQ